MKNFNKLIIFSKVSKLLTFFLVLSLTFWILNKINQYYSIAKSENFAVLIAYNPQNLKDGYLEAYKSVLEEEGVPYKAINYSILISLEINKNFILKHPVLILPDGLIQSINPDSKEWFFSYLKQGGNILLVYDAGTKNPKGFYLDTPLFATIAGINYCLYSKLKEKSYTVGYVEIDRKDVIKITPGKLDKQSKLIKGYSYGKLEYPMAITEILDNSAEILASGLINNIKIPLITLKNYEKGKIMYVNLPLGFLKAYSDDFILRIVIRTFLFDILNIPHLSNTPSAKGGLVINWHIDSSIDWNFLPKMINENYLTKNLEFSLHITAGDFRDTPGDNLGFDACGKGKKYIKMIKEYGEIGSHGGWAHNFFSYGIIKNQLTNYDIEYYIAKNNKCLENIIGYKIKEYSAPNGVHPQPITTKILEKYNIVAYYYTGDTGSSPNRTFYGGNIVSKNVIAFPVCNYEENASLFEMWKAGKTEQEVENFLLSLLKYISQEKVIRLFYSHLYDIPHYPNAIKKLITQAQELQDKELIKVKSMKYFAEFLLRFLETKYTFKIKNNILEIKLENPKSLKEISLAIPKKYIIINKPHFLITLKDKIYNYYVIEKDVNNLVICFKKDSD